jgi:pyochelin biosynthetic protein PchC
MTPQISFNGCVIKYPGSNKGPARHQLVIFPHAGGSASFYQPWRQKIPNDCDLLIVQYPARETAAGKPAWENTEQAITACSNALCSLLGIAPITIFGHSMGALLALHVAASLDDTRFTIYQRILSAQKIPQALTELNQEQIRKHWLAGILDHSAQSGVMELDDRIGTRISAFILQDLELLGQLALLPVKDTPLRIFGSENDPLISVSQLKSWQSLTANSQLTIWPGDHFYFTRELERFLAELIPAHHQ